MVPIYFIALKLINEQAKSLGHKFLKYQLRPFLVDLRLGPTNMKSAFTCIRQHIRDASMG